MRASGYDRAANDWYIEPRWCVDALLDAENFSGTIWDPACGSGNIPRACNDRKLWAMGTDIADRGYGQRADFLDPELPGCFLATSIISNPPFKDMQRWTDVALRRTTDRVALLGRLAFLEGQARAGWFNIVPLCRVYVLSKRISMPPGGVDVEAKGGSIAFAWFVFQHGFRGDATLHRLLPSAPDSLPGGDAGALAATEMSAAEAVADRAAHNSGADVAPSAPIFSDDATRCLR